MFVRARPYLVLVLLWAGYFHPLLLHPDRVLYTDYSDFVAEHLPAKLFLSREWRASGEIPLWNPHHFCGNPFVHDIQVGVFYPPYAVTYVVPEEHLGAALSWVIALHVLLAGATAHAYARWRGLDEAGGLVAAVGFMLSAKWMTHLILAGHTITAGLAWLPLVLLGLEAATRRGRVWPAVGAGAAYALLVLGTHPQWAFYATLFAAAWTLGVVFEPAGEGTARRLARWAGAGVVVGVVAAALTAVQLLPTWEAAGESSRTTGGVQAQGLLTGLFTLFGMVGPAAVDDPPMTWEYRGLLGAFWLTAAAAAPAVVGRRAWWPAGVLAAFLVFAAGGSVLVETVPGFRLFRLPARSLVIAAFPLAFLAGMVTDALAREGWKEDARVGLRRGFLAVAVFAVLPALMCAGRLSRGTPVGALWNPFVVYWGTVVVSAVVFLWLCATDRGPARVRLAAWLSILLAELVTPLPPVAVRPQAELYPTSPGVDFLTRHARPGGARALDWYVDELPRPASAFGVGNPLALVHGLEVVNGYNPLDVRHYREFVWTMVGGEAAGAPRIAYAVQTLPDFASERRNMFDLLGARFLVCRDGERAALRTADWRKVATDPGPPTVPPRGPGLPDRLPPHAVYENPAALPRAWVVGAAITAPPGRELDVLAACDFRRVVLLSASNPPPAATGPPGTAEVTEYRPDRVVVRVTGGGGFLVLADVWFPGWVCRVDGREVPVYRANHAFRAVAVPAGAGEVVFSFEPRSYRLGWWVSATAAGGLLLLGLSRLALGLTMWRSDGTTPDSRIPPA